MLTTEFTFKGKDGKSINAVKWEPKLNNNPKIIIQISHGMAEHKDRYSDFAKILINQGMVVYANDHRGHGKTAKNEDELGYFDDNNGWDKVVEDMHELTLKIKNDYPETPIVLLGHSMGSFLTRTYIQKFGNEINGVILSGTTYSSNLKTTFGLIVTKREIKKIGKKGKSYKLDKLSFGSFNKQFQPNKTEFDWLSRDEENVKKYIDDPHCGFVCTAGFFKDLLYGISIINNIEYVKNTPKELPIFIISGEKDPVGENTKGVLKVLNLFKKAGLKNVKHKFYKDARHEILNEINKNEVYSDIINWLNSEILKKNKVLS
ncbi:alpha/beta hydrolase [Tepiditoga spiralis]|uniref:Alpha/beta hydrolase n=1 Tax=Tepiditoga spiralis TaxID=2108365 RepID=A0A7G1G874_9BACT|nr:alpha/beta hydrolase [Tepiditoga spiralis]BBE31424.1 alpha/beta hydrolase [Tepiditoga spiralis]